MKPIQTIIRFFIVLAFASTLFSVPVYAQTRHASEIERLVRTHTAGQVLIGKGDALSFIAKSYSRLNGIPFEVALKGLIVANPNAFEDAQHNLIMGATFVLPLKKDILIAAQTGSLPIEVVAPPVLPVVEAVVTEHVAAPIPVVAKVEPIEATVSIEPWAWPLLAVLLLMILVGASRAFKTRQSKVVFGGERHKNGAPKVVLGALVQLPTHQNTVLTKSVDEDDLPESDHNARFNKVLAGLSADSLDLTLMDKPVSSIVSSTVLPVVAQAETTIHAKVEAMNTVQVSAELLEIETAAVPALNMDVPQFLHQFSHRLPEPTFTSVDYEDLLDKARLQAWLNIHTPEQILLFAQDAYDARYEDVAQLMLNDVLLRGTAEQVTAVLNLRYLWSYPKGVF